MGRTAYRALPGLAILIALAAFAASQETAASGATHTLTVVVENVNREGGNIGVLVFNSRKGWPEDRFAALKDIVVPAHPGTVIVTIPDLPAGEYAVSIGHDVNRNHKVDKNMFGMPKEQWGMSNNPHATIKAPPFSAARFSLNQDLEIHVKLQ
ncbi:MAG TPA: DUF2141 domain-containing protein [Candidatus Angelobacter sp.]|nr:DUF2141 domain-containing protein [Candidatus Angelobacter sp.]